MAAEGLFCDPLNSQPLTPRFTACQSKTHIVIFLNLFYVFEKKGGVEEPFRKKKSLRPFVP